MFGILKKKLGSFGEKLKEKLATKEEAQQPNEVPEEKTLEEPLAREIEVKEASQETAPEIKKPEPQKTTSEPEKAPRVETPIAKKEGEKAPEQKKKTREERAREMEEKLFKEIGAELGEEVKAPQEAGEELAEEKETAPAPKIEAKKEAAPQPTLETKIQPTPSTPSQEKKKGLFGKLFGGKKKEAVEEKPTAPKALENEPILEEKAPEPKAPEKEKPAPAPEKELEIEEEIAEEEEEKEESAAEKEEEALARMEAKRKELAGVEIKKAEEDKRELRSGVGAGGKLKGLIFGGVEISEKDVSDLLWELELSLIESDVEQDAARELVAKIKGKLVGQKVSLKNLDEYLKEQIKEILAEMIHTETINLLEMAKQHKPLKILMLGPNGAGKTTSIAKLTHLFQKNGKSVILAAGDTFRAAAIDQLEEHANKLGVRVVKQQYGADPAAVAFDAVKAAEAGNIDVIIIDSAGRQETNKNLMEELKKIERVAKPDLRLYVGEAYAGQGLLEQAQEFDSALGIDGFILTKIDADAKGGTTISLLYKIKKPILYIGTGQGYDDFEAFTPEFILKRII